MRLFQLIDNAPQTWKIKEKSCVDFITRFVPVRYLYVHTCVLTVIPHRKLRLTNSKSKIKLLSVNNEIKQKPVA